MRRPVTDDALLDDVLSPPRRRLPIPNPALSRFLDELDGHRRDLLESTERFALANDRLEATLLTLTKRLRP